MGDEPNRRTVALSRLATSAGLDLEAADLLVSDVLVSDVTHDHRSVRPGSLFCCIVGTERDGHDLASEAVAAGAVALLVQRPTGAGVPELVVSDTRAAMGLLAAAFWGDPSTDLAVIGVTGTNGKTTVVTLIDEILTTLGVSVGSIGTLTGVRTTPESTDLQRTLAVMRDRGISVVALEVSSHALALGRVDGCHFAVAAFTNLGSDHLDFHETPERYFEAKARLFEPDRCEVAVVNVDDVHGRLLRDTIGAHGAPALVAVTTEGASVELSGTSSRITWRSKTLRLPLPGRFNVTNAMIAAECVVALGYEPAVVAEALGVVTPPPGRLEFVDRGQPFAVIVDYAHTPDAIENVLVTARELISPSGSVISVIGAGGDRDRSKRPLMGQVASDLADLLFITSDNPRSEDPSAIIAAVASGCHGTEPVLIADRREAILEAVASARPGDVVVLAGKGHEVTQVIGGETLPFDDREVAALAIDERRLGGGWA